MLPHRRCCLQNRCLRARPNIPTNSSAKVPRGSRPLQPEVHGSLAGYSTYIQRRSCTATGSEVGPLGARLSLYRSEATPTCCPLGGVTIQRQHRLFPCRPQWRSRGGTRLSMDALWKANRHHASPFTPGRGLAAGCDRN